MPNLIEISAIRTNGQEEEDVLIFLEHIRFIKRDAVNPNTHTYISISDNEGFTIMTKFEDVRSLLNYAMKG